MAQLGTASIYGREGTQTILGDSATKVVFAERDPEIANRISKAFGQQEIHEYQEEISYGAHEMRDGVSLSRQTRFRSVISASDIQALKPNHAYVNLPAATSIGKVRLDITNYRQGSHPHLHSSKKSNPNSQAAFHDSHSLLG